MATTLDLGPGLGDIPLQPGRYANAIQRDTSARHALQVVRDGLTSSFVLELEPDGSATLCRGWRYLSFNDGPHLHTTESLREQLGYRGSWKTVERIAEVTLNLDEGVCPRVGEYTQLVPNHAREWRLRCVSFAPRTHPVLKGPGLACQVTNLQSGFGEDEPHVVPGLLPDRLIVLGPGNGLRIRVVAQSLVGGAAPDIRVDVSSELIPTDAWEHPF